MPRILLIDDDDDLTAFLRHALEEQGHQVKCLERAEHGPELLAAEAFDLVLLDNKMPGMTGIDFLEALERGGVRSTVILMTGEHNDRTAIRAINLGAFDYVIKPPDYDALLAELTTLIGKALEIARPIPDVRIEEPAGQASEDSSTILGKSRQMLDVLKLIGRFAKGDDAVLILGETGTGKELVARAVHTNSPRRHMPFVAMNCTAFNENLLDDELFGHEPGAFTGAHKLRKGRFEHANGGTLFLDEVGDMPAALQAKLLRVLESQEVFRIGSNEPIKVHVRLVSATHRDLEAAVRAGTFRQDLFYRLNRLAITVPPLRERGADVQLLARHFLSRAAAVAGRPVPALHESALEKLRGYDWPGNVRQLQNVLCKAVWMCRGRQIRAEDLDFREAGAEAPAPDGHALGEDEARAGLRRTIGWAWDTGREDLWPVLRDMLERELLQFALTRLGDNQVQAARRLGVARNTLRDRVEKYGLLTAPQKEA
jgi:DNA-binding NtrC family response regulator